MSFTLQDLDDAPGAVHRAAAERLHHAADRLDHDGGADRAAAVHAARKDLKRTRSLLRLARPALSKKAYRRRNRALRDLAARLAGARDADAQVAAVEGLHDHAAGRLPLTAFEAVADAGRASGDGGAPDLAAVAHDLREAAREPWPLRDLDVATLADGLAVTYARGHAALADAQADPSAERLHEWRKRVKDLRHQAQLLEPAAPRVMKAIAKDADRLGEALGDEHDLALLAGRLADADDPVGQAPVDMEAFRALVAHRRGALRAEAAEAARQVYAERPKAFRRRVRALVGAAPSLDLA